VVAEADAILARRAPRAALHGRKVVVTAGPTFEAVDDVRFLGNRSSGKMGFALAGAAAALGAEVTLIAGPVSLPTPGGVARRVEVESALEMQAALEPAAAGADAVVMAAAVADFRPASRQPGKLSRRNTQGATAPPLTLPLVANPDLLAGLGGKRRGPSPFLVGFAAETGLAADQLIARARAKLSEKQCDLVVANDVGAPGLGFASDDNAVLLVHADGATQSLGPKPKIVLAEEIWAAIVPRLPPGSSP
jgi:phosphopantothenoylcysteine decarboxylase/phosphopantothenate--cysteine ligase